MSIFTGSAVAVITPFINGAVDYPALKDLFDFHLANKTDAIVVCGTTGEASTLTTEEKRAVIAFAVKEINGRIPVIAGTGGNNTINVVADSKAACGLGADALLIVTPYYNKTSQPGLIAHYNAVADAVDRPIIVYNVPGRTGLNVLPATMAELARHGNIVGIKEATGNIEQIVTLAAACPDLDIYAGNDDHVVPMMAIGGKGVISTIANVIPRDMHDMCQAFFDGNVATARQLQIKVHPIWKAAFCDVNPIPVKTMLQLMGMCSGDLRLPLVPPSPAAYGKIKEALENYGLI